MQNRDHLSWLQRAVGLWASLRCPGANVAGSNPTCGRTGTGRGNDPVPFAAETVGVWNSAWWWRLMFIGKSNHAYGIHAELKTGCVDVGPVLVYGRLSAPVRLWICRSASATASRKARLAVPSRQYSSVRTGPRRSFPTRLKSCQFCCVGVVTDRARSCCGLSGAKPAHGWLPGSLNRRASLRSPSGCWRVDAVTLSPPQMAGRPTWLYWQLHGACDIAITDAAGWAPR